MVAVALTALIFGNRILLRSLSKVCTIHIWIWKKIGKALRRDSIAMHKYNLLPCLLYREPDGLFIMEESESLNGILLLQKEGERFSRLPNGYYKIPPFYYPNPFVKDELYVPNMERLFE